MRQANRHATRLIGLHLLASAGALTFGYLAFAEGPAEMTKERHAELAQSYDREAQGLESKAAEHERMAKVYETMHEGHKHGGQRGAAAHCRNLVANYKAAAADARELSKHHRSMADDAKQ